MNKIFEKILDAFNPSRIETRNYKNKLTELELNKSYTLTTEKSTCGGYCVTLEGKHLKGNCEVTLNTKIRVYLSGEEIFNYNDDNPLYFHNTAKIDSNNYQLIKHYFVEV